jgi:hypothetical protein
MGAGLLLAVVSAAAPVLWLVAVAAIVVALAALARDRRSLFAALATVAVAPVVLLPWTWHVATSATLLLGGSGLPETVGSRQGVPVADLLLVRPGGPAQPPLWVWAPILAMAVVAQLSARRAARVGLVLFAVGAGAALVVSRLTPLGSIPYARYWTGAPLAVAALGAILAAVVAAEEGPGALRRRAFGWRHAGAAILVIAAIAGIVVTGLGWLVRGSDRPLTASTTSVLPVFAQAEAAAPTAPRVLVLRGDHGTVRYALIRGAAGPRLGDADVLGEHSPAAARRALSAAIADAASGRDKALDELAALGVSLVVVPEAADATLTRLADVDGLARVPATSTVVYRLTRPAGELLIYDGLSAQAVVAGTPLPSGVAAKALAVTPGHADLALPSATGGRRLLVLAEPRSADWHATLSGHRLQRATAFGWAQAWWLPADSGRLRVDRAGGHRHDRLIVEGVLVLLALVLCLPSRGRQR